MFCPHIRDDLAKNQFVPVFFVESTKMPKITQFDRDNSQRAAGISRHVWTEFESHVLKEGGRGDPAKT